ncbi:LysR family transcriptional regulator [Marinobacteraceae bacterium S3BR75-40.1]
MTRLNLEIRHLRTLRALQDTGSLVEAAQVLCVTQSALSHQLKELEQRLETPLFLRKSRPLRLTQAGQRILALADEVLPRMAEAERDLLRLKEGHSGRLHLVLECHSCFNWLMPALNHYREQWPEVSLDLSTGFHFDALPALARGDVDLVITADPEPDRALVYLPLFRYESRLVLPREHTLLERPTIQPHDLADQTLISYPVGRDKLDVWKQFMQPAGQWFAQVRETELTLMMLQLVASGRGLAVLPNWAVAEFSDQQLVATRSLGAQGVWTTLYAAVRADMAAMPYVEGFTELARDVCFRTLRGITAAPQSVKG